MLSKITNHCINGKHGHRIAIDCVYQNDGGTKPLVIFSHGFKGFKDWGHFNRTADYFANRGFVFVKFNFSHNGHTISRPKECTEIERFGNNNFSKELDDLGSVIDWVSEEPRLSGVVDHQKICLLGHSRGGGISILKAAEDSRISKLVTWAAVGDFASRYNAEQLESWKENGRIDIVNGRTGQILPLYYQLYQDFKENSSRLDIPKASAKIDIPFLIVHGTGDEAVSFEAAKKLHHQCQDSQLLLIENSGHTFEGKHPMGEKEKYPENLKQVVEETISFFD